jgi:conjugal transfer/type IV secretion protein DotA/TraY
MKIIKTIKNKLINILFVGVAMTGMVTTAQAEVTSDRDTYDTGYLMAAESDAQDLSNAALAQVINTDGINKEAQEQVMDLFNNPPKGVAFMLVEKLLGTWVGDLFDDQTVKGGNDRSVTVITRVAGMTNILALVLGVVIIGYVILAGVLNTASSGQLMGKSWSSVWLPIRTALAFGLIMPMGQTGDEKVLAGGYLSPVQTGVVYLALVGSNAGDMVWAEAIDAVTNGSPIVATPKALSMGFVSGIAANAACGYLSSMEALKTVTEKPFEHEKVYLSRVSAVVIEWQEEQEDFFSSNKNKVGPGRASLGQMSKTYYTYKNLKDGTFKTDVDRIHKTGNIKTIKFGPEVIGNWGDKSDCGSMTVATQSKPSEEELANNTSAVKVMNDVEKVMGMEVVNFISNLSQMGIFERLYESPGDGGLGGFTAYNQAMDPTDNGDINKGKKLAIIKNKNEIATIYSKQIILFSNSIGNRLIEATKVKGDENDYKRLLGQGGWATAGLWFFQLSKFSHSAQVVTQNVASSVMLPKMGDEVCGYLDHVSRFMNGTIDFSWEEGFSHAEAELDCATHYNAYPIIGDIHIESQAILNSDAGMIVSMAEAKGISSDDVNESNFSIWMAQKILGTGTGLGNSWLANPDGVGGNTNTDIDVTDGSGAQNPFLTLTSIGHAINLITGIIASSYIALQLFQLMAPTGKVAVAANKVFGGKGGSGGWLRGGGMIVGMLGSIFVGTLIGQGYILAYGIPFIPIFIWTMLVIGWLVMIIEAIIAAPLAVILMATPEGEGISGTRMERAISLMAAVIMRPALSIMGLVASVTVAYLGFSLFNLFFWRSAGMVTSWGLFEIIAILTMYVTGALTICRYSFSLIYELPNHILEWMNGKGRAFGESEGTQMAQGASASIGTASQQGFSRGAQFLGGAQTRATEDKRAEQLKKEADSRSNTSV